MLADLLKQGPRVVDADQAERRLGDMLAASSRLSKLVNKRPPLADFLKGVFDGSSYLWSLAERDPDRFATLLGADADEMATSILASMAAAAGPDTDRNAAMAQLRQGKRDAALLAGICDLGGVWPGRRVTAFLTDMFDAAISAAIRQLLWEATARGQFHPQDPADPERGSGLIIWGMGKLGAREINYSSDIDLIVFYDPAIAPLADGVEPGPFFTRLTQHFVRMLQDRTADGYVARTDLRLRPDPGSTSVAIPVEQALVYYETVGQNWERAALIKARCCAGDIAAGEAVYAELAPFIWRKYLDYAAISDIHAMKRQIHAHRGHGAIAIEGHNVKLGRGGIREIEFFAQTQQLVAGGRNPELRIKDTESALGALVEAKWISPEARDELVEAYWFLRGIEHRLQMIADEQTHVLPDSREGMERFARFCGYSSRDELAAALMQRFERVEEHYAHLFEDAPTLSSTAGNLVFAGEDDDPETLATLSRMRFEDPVRVLQLVRGWHHGRYQSMKSARARELLTELMPALLQAFAETYRPDAALIAFDHVLGRMPAGVQFMALLRSNPSLLGLIADVLGTAPRLGEAVARRPHVLDAVIEPSFFASVPTLEEQSSRLSVALNEAESYEDVLNRARIFGQEQMVLIGVRVLSGTLPPEQAGAAFSRLADLMIQTLTKAAESEIVTVHGRVPGGEAAILAMGRLGSCEMTASSDLDLILLYDHDNDVQGSDGRRELSPTQYFSRLIQRSVSALTAQTAEGALYEVDMRLRPSGRAGPLATRITAFERYQAEEAWTWEHMALTRARVVTGSEAFRAHVETAIREILCRKRDPRKIARDVTEMRTMIAQEKGDADPWDLKLAKGGLLDIEFLIQYLQLVHANARPEILTTSTGAALDVLKSHDLLSVGDWEVLKSAHRRYHALMQVLRLCLKGRFDPGTAGEGLLRLLARSAGLPDFAALQAELRDDQVAVRKIFKRVVSA
ncbi:bifunctional [glutamine synthetase] adenylyltransferase/[glutamine synthetase]-adenylyl-L-tyrosine phosphorylase [Agaricicola taiwanensis]|uniref:bifunctional [glutamine synthetase] adenylyltransferase/[glutamine synthetase]-adenylyl-L-tyrosine phosphorylase n=1 Tax=Agaricicola taiwanensis TaxID=591372 RepID=UPI001E414861|nr:bifunctional [glutamine synthetase] adenylyltransferase/[glutamine synthetase]-adenylyl-L-tyrosine phosphorylase [Agaricicola taiwanensis]